MKWQEVKDLFRDNVGDVSYVELFNDENEKPRGCGILEFASEDLAKNAVDKMHRYEYKGRKLVVKEDFETSLQRKRKAGRWESRSLPEKRRAKAAAAAASGATQSGTVINNYNCHISNNYRL